MIFSIVFIAILCLIGTKAAPIGRGFDDYMSPQKTTAIKGIFVLFVLFSHMRQYIKLDLSLLADDSFQYIMSHVGQLMVVMFLYYSGYGIAQAIERKKGYVSTLPKRRMFKVMLHFWIAVALFLLVGLLLGKHYPTKRVILSLLAWETVGNSAWFIFCIAALYLVTYASFTLLKKHPVAATALVTVLTAVYVLVMFKVKGVKDHWWYDTALCYPLGMWYSLAKKRIDRVLLKSGLRRLAASAIAFAVFSLLYTAFRDARNEERIIIFLFVAPALALVVTFVTMSLSIGNNKTLIWFGKRVFGIYMLQRIPMMLLAHWGIADSRYLFAIIAFASTLVLAELFERFTARVDKLLKI